MTREDLGAMLEEYAQAAYWLEEGWLVKPADPHDPTALRATMTRIEDELWGLITLP